MTLVEALTIMFKHKKMIATLFLSILAVVTAVTFLQRPVYEATSSLLVKPVKEDSARPGMTAENNNGTPLLSQEELINTEIQILTGQELAEKVITTVKLENLYPDLAKKSSLEEAKGAMFKAVQIFQKSLKVVGVRKSNVISVSFQNNNPEMAARAVNVLVEYFKDKHLSLHSDPQSTFIKSQLASFEEKLKTSERSLQEYQQKNNVFSLDEQRGLLLRQRTDFDSAYKVATDSISETSKRIAALKSQMKYVSSNSSRYTPTDRDKIITDAKSRLLELQLKEQELRRKYTPTNRLVVDAKREVDLVNNFVREQEEGIAGKVKTGNPVYQSVEMDLLRAEADLSSQIAKAQALKGQLKQLDQEIAGLDLSESKVQNLKREVAINEKNYKTYLDRHEEAQISVAMNRLKLSNISVIQAAFVPVKPIKPKKKLNILLGVLFGMVAGITCAYLAENIGQTFSDPESIERYLELPVLLTVSTKEG